MITVFGHGLVQRADVPIPAVAFAWSAAAVLVISFVGLAALWPKPRLQEIGWQAVPGGRALGARPLRDACGAVGVFLLGVVIWTGLAGEPSTLLNFAPTFVYVIFWIGLVFVSLLLGDVFRALNPWLALGRWLRLTGHAAYPQRLGRWPAAAGLLVFTWTELVGRWGETPGRIAIGALVYSALTLLAMRRYGAETWAARGEAFSVYFNFFSRLSIFERRDGVIGRRPLLGGLPKLEPLPGTVAVVAVMIGTVTFDGLSQGPAWTDDINIWFTDVFDALGFSEATTVDLSGTLGLLLGVALIAGFYRLGISGAESVGGGLTARRLRDAFVHALIPIALVYAMAHYFSALVTQGQAIAALASNPLGSDWDLFGTAGWGIDFTILSQNAIWYAQIAFVVLGHVAGLVLAHDRALTLYPDARVAVRSQYWMLSIMVGFTSLALWLLSQANA